MIDHSAQAFIADGFPVNSTHVRDFMPHDEIDGGLILGFVGHGAEGMSQRVEAESFPAFDVELLQELCNFLCQGAVGNVLRPGQPTLCQEHKARMFHLLRIRAMGQRFA